MARSRKTNPTKKVTQAAARSQSRREQAKIIYITLDDSRSHVRVHDVWNDTGGAGRPPSMSQIAKWSSEDNWTKQAKDYDGQRDRRRITNALETLDDIFSRHRDAGRVMLNLGVRGLDALSDDPGKIPPSVLPTYVRVGIELERMAAGLITERRTITLELSARVWQVFNVVIDRDDVTAMARQEMLKGFRTMLVEAATAEDIGGDVPDFLRDEAAAELTQEEIAVASLAIEAVRRGMAIPDHSQAPPMPPRGQYGQEYMNQAGHR